MSNGTDNPHAHSVRQEDDDREMSRRDEFVAEADRRVMDGDFRNHIMTEIDTLKTNHQIMDAKLDELLVILRGSRFIAGLLKYLATVGIPLAALWAWAHGAPGPWK